MIELMVVLLIGFIFLGFAYTTWQRYNRVQQLRLGAAQVAADLREAEERARAQRAAYTVTFAVSSPTYTIAKTGGGFLKTSVLSGVTTTANTTVTFSAFGQPDAAHTITLQDSAGTSTASVTAAGGITYQGP